MILYVTMLLLAALTTYNNGRSNPTSTVTLTNASITLNMSCTAITSKLNAPISARRTIDYRCSNASAVCCFSKCAICACQGSTTGVICDVRIASPTIGAPRNTTIKVSTSRIGNLCNSDFAALPGNFSCPLSSDKTILGFHIGSSQIFYVRCCIRWIACMPVRTPPSGSFSNNILLYCSANCAIGIS